ncbi:MAG: UDP-N-acetylglucosamine 2-epimerase (non-hydrolyzing) [Planctomycetes bacterium]|nr:UDP-N-acetylglucosamine 2-epimerase (non-hydrolyzing) [Planctomycetota bacterium]
MAAAGPVVASIVGARPQFIKAAVVSRALAAAGIREFLVHTGQHYDYGMSDLFFRELEIPEPRLNLAVGSGSHGRQTAAMLEALEEVFVEMHPALALVYGDTNSTLAAALAAVKLHIEVAHVEAGLRSFNMRMPEEINRILSDKISSLLLCPCQTAVDNLAREGVTDGVHLSGDVMYDAALFYAGRAPGIDQTCAAEPGEGNFYLATVHRAENTDDASRLGGIIQGLEGLPYPVLLPLHPRTGKRLEELGIHPSGALRLVEPVGYLEMVALQRAARVILTDSGGMQKEALFHSTPCVTLRDETEWVETVEAGWNILTGADPEKIASAVGRFESAPPVTVCRPYGDGHAGRRIASLVKAHLDDRSGRG